jgi:dihydrofolate reductase
VIKFDEIEGLKERVDGDILVAGSATLVQGMTARGLVDEYRLMIFPIVLGSGRRLFADSDEAVTMELAESRALASGTLINTYRPAAVA